MTDMSWRDGTCACLVCAGMVAVGGQAVADALDMLGLRAPDHMSLTLDSALDIRTLARAMLCHCQAAIPPAVQAMLREPGAFFHRPAPRFVHGKNPRSVATYRP